MPILRRIVRLAKAEQPHVDRRLHRGAVRQEPDGRGPRRHHRGPRHVPYIALQLKAVSDSVAITDDTRLSGRPRPCTSSSPTSRSSVTMMLALFAVVFGTRHTDATEHQDGLILAIATESMVKLVAFTTVGLVVIFGIFDGFGDLVATARASPEVMARLSHETPLAALDRADHAVGASPSSCCRGSSTSRWWKTGRRASCGSPAVLFPLYLVAINLFVMPVAIAGLLHVRRRSATATSTCCPLPLAHGLPFLTLLTFHRRLFRGDRDGDRGLRGRGHHGLERHRHAGLAAPERRAPRRRAGRLSARRS